MKRIRRRFHESELAVPIPCVIVFRVHEEHAGPDRVSGVDAAKNRILKQCAPDAVALMCLIHCKAGEEYRRDRASP